MSQDARRSELDSHARDVAFMESIHALRSALHASIAQSNSDPGGLLRWVGLAIIVLTIASKLIRLAGAGIGEFEPAEFIAVLLTGLILVLAASGVRASLARAGGEATTGLAGAISGMWVGSEYRPLPKDAGPGR